MKTLSNAVVFVWLVMGAVSGAYAQSSSREASPSLKSPGVLEDEQLYRSTRILGSVVRDTEEKKIGEIKDMLLDRARGEIAYVVVRFFGKKQSQQQLHALPWRALEPGKDGKYYILRVTGDIIAQAPAFDRRRWPDIHDPKWGEEVDRYWNRAVSRGPFTSDPVAGGRANGGAETSGAGSNGNAGAASGGARR